MKQEHKHPGTEAPTRLYACIRCFHHNTVKGQWNTYTGRWLMSFNCHNCDAHQEAFVSEPHSEDKPRKIKQAFKDA